jgi:hypothetical protein
MRLCNSDATSADKITKVVPAHRKESLPPNIKFEYDFEDVDSKEHIICHLKIPTLDAVAQCRKSKIQCKQETKKTQTKRLPELT